MVPVAFTIKPLADRQCLYTTAAEFIFMHVYLQNVLAQLCGPHQQPSHEVGL